MNVTGVTLASQGSQKSLLLHLRYRLAATTRYAIIRLYFCLTKMARNLRVTKWLGPVPAAAVCSQCGREFKVPLSLLKQTTNAQESLRKQFAEHVCPDEAEGKSREAQPK